MAIDVLVRAYSGEIEARGPWKGVNALCQRASDLGMPLLGCVDPYDDTVFNQTQMRLVVPELQRLTDEDLDEEAQAIEEILQLCERVKRKPHRYLVFSGD